MSDTIILHRCPKCGGNGYDPGCNVLDSGTRTHDDFVPRTYVAVDALLSLGVVNAAASNGRRCSILLAENVIKAALLSVGVALSEDRGRDA